MGSKHFENERRTAKAVATLTVFLGAIVWALTALACGNGASGAVPPDRPGFDMTLQEATDTTVVLRADWQGEADLWRWTVDRAGSELRSGEFADTTAVDLTLPRLDSTWNGSFCVHGVNVRGDQEAAGNDACGTFSVPPVPLEAPSSPDSLSVQVDTTTALNVDSVTVHPDRILVHLRGDSTTGWDTLSSTEAFVDGQRIDSIQGRSYGLTGRLWRDGEIVGCSGPDCDHDEPDAPSLVRLDGKILPLEEAVRREFGDRNLT